MIRLQMTFALWRNYGKVLGLRRCWRLAGHLLKGEEPLVLRFGPRPIDKGQP